MESQAKPRLAYEVGGEENLRDQGTHCIGMSVELSVTHIHSLPHFLPVWKPGCHELHVLTCL